MKRAFSAFAFAATATVFATAIATAALFAMSAFAAALAMSCAGGPAPVVPPAPAAPAAPVGVAKLGLLAAELSVSAIDLDSVKVSLELRAVNEGNAELELGSLELRCDSGAVPVFVALDFSGERLGVGSSVTRTLGFALDLPPAAKDAATRIATGASAGTAREAAANTAPSDVPLRVEARLAYSAAGAGAGSAVLVHEGRFTRVLPPSLRIASIHIIKDELINTRLRVDLEVANPNAFGLSFAALDYRLYGEGRYWASGSIAEPFAVRAGESTGASLYLTMNFGDMSRSLLDQVIRLATVNYRLEGRGRILTGLEFLPEFILPFDMAGSTRVSR